MKEVAASTIITGEDARVLRNIRGLKQTTVAKKLKISQQAYSKKEKKDFLTPKEVTEILDALDCTKEEITVLRGILCWRL
jgi:DNA-binding XRE family transcriptional regulator